MSYLALIKKFVKISRNTFKQFKIPLGIALGVVAGIIYKINDDYLKSWAPLFVFLVSGIVLLLVLKLFKHKSLPTKIILGMILGILAGVFFRSQALFLEPVGTVFIRLISLIVIPLVFISLFLGTASLGNIKKLGRIGLKTISYYLLTTIVAILIGLILVSVVQPGLDVQPDIKDRKISLNPLDKNISVVDNLINIIPTNPFQALIEGNMLQVIFLAILFGLAVTSLGKSKSRLLIEWFETLNQSVFNLVAMVMKMAPIGIFALISTTIGKFGFEVLVSLFKYGLVVIFGLILHASIILSIAVKTIGKLNPLKFWIAIRPAVLVAFSTSSSNVTLPVTMEVVERDLKVPRLISSFVLPLGATINMDGTALYQCVSIFFISQVYGIELNLMQMMIVILSVVFASIGTAGAPMAGVLILVMILRSLGIPAEGIAMIMGIERIMDMSRTTVNIIGDASASVVISQIEKGK